MSTMIDSIGVAVPVRVAYDQWTQFEQFPEFMDAVQSVEQLDDQKLRWTAKVAGIANDISVAVCNAMGAPTQTFGSAAYGGELTVLKG